MKTHIFIASAVAAAMLAMTVTLFAAESAVGGAKSSTEPIYGYRMMSQQERDQYREKLRTARSSEERQTIRDEHHKQMDERARERGVMTSEHRGPHGQMGPANGMHNRGGKGQGAAGRGNCAPPADCPGSVGFTNQR